MSRSVTPLSILSVFLQTLEKCEIKKCLLVFLSASLLPENPKIHADTFKNIHADTFKNIQGFMSILDILESS